MADGEKRFFFRKKRECGADEARQTLTESLEQTRAQIAQAYLGFNTAADSDLIESYVFEINALQARYSYLLRQVKTLDGAGREKARVPVPVQRA